MRRVQILLLLVSPLVSGCAMCCGVDDYNYSAYGGTWQRGDMSHGRVGSVFADVGEIESVPLEAGIDQVEVLPAPEIVIPEE